MRHLAKLALLATVSTLAACSGEGKHELIAAETARCEAGELGPVLGVENAEAVHVVADAEAGLPAFCEVKGTLAPAEGSTIGVVYRLPDEWNGKVLGLGGGGWAGNVTLMAAGEGLKAGYATAQTDGGHPGTNPWDNAWVANPESVEDFSHRAIHEMTVGGKALVAAYYGMSHDRAYFHGCSTGGRMALMEAQRYPEDYDAIIAAAPVYTLQVQTSAVLRNNGFSAPGASFNTDQLKLVQDAVLAQCDAEDGLADGLVGDPRACSFDPAALSCKAQGASGDCLNDAQVRALGTMYDGIRASDGSWAQLPMSKGSEEGWSMFVATGGAEDQTRGGGIFGLTALLFGRDSFDYARMTPSDVLTARSSAFAGTYEAKDADLSDFFARGGKLLMWHGEGDPGPSPVGTIDYVEAVKASAEGAADGLRMFLAPGVGHCRGGPGPDLIDTLSALDEWVSSGSAPEVLVARKEGSPLARKLCAWPQVAHYAGEGDPNHPDSWSCVARKAS